MLYGGRRDWIDVINIIDYIQSSSPTRSSLNGLGSLHSCPLAVPEYLLFTPETRMIVLKSKSDPVTSLPMNFFGYYCWLS